jgi:hypothetical protein
MLLTILYSYCTHYIGPIEGGRHPQVRAWRRGEEGEKGQHREGDGRAGRAERSWRAWYRSCAEQGGAAQGGRAGTTVMVPGDWLSAHCYTLTIHSLYTR